MKSERSFADGNHRFRTQLERREAVGTTTFLRVPEDVMAAFAPRKRVPVAVAIAGHEWRSTIARYGDRYLIPVRKEIRDVIGADAGDAVVVELRGDDAPRMVPVPADLAAALAEAGVAQRFADLAFTHRLEYVRWIEEAKRAETRRGRIDKAVAMIREKRTSR